MSLAVPDKKMPPAKAHIDDVVPPPANVTVYDTKRRPVLYTADGKPLKRKVGFGA